MAFFNIGSTSSVFSGVVSVSDIANATIPLLGSNSIGLVSVNMLPEGTGQTVSVTWAGSPMTYVNSVFNGTYLATLFSLDNPPNNQNVSIVASYGLSIIHNTMIATAWAEANSTITLDDISSDVETTTPSILSTQSESNELVISSSSTDFNNISATPTTNCSVLQSWDQGGNTTIMAYQIHTSSGNILHTHNFTTGGTSAIVSASFKEASSPPVVVSSSKLFQLMGIGT